MVSSVRRYADVLRREEGYVLRRAIGLEEERKAEKTWNVQNEEESVNVWISK